MTTLKTKYHTSIGTVTTEKRPHNSGLAKVAVQCSEDTFFVNQTLILDINIYGESRHLRRAPKGSSNGRKPTKNRQPT